MCRAGIQDAPQRQLRQWDHLHKAAEVILQPDGNEVSFQVCRVRAVSKLPMPHANIFDYAKITRNTKHWHLSPSAWNTHHTLNCQHFSAFRFFEHQRAQGISWLLPKWSLLWSVCSCMFTPPTTTLKQNCYSDMQKKKINIIFIITEEIACENLSSWELNTQKVLVVNILSSHIRPSKRLYLASSRVFGWSPKKRAFHPRDNLFSLKIFFLLFSFPLNKLFLTHSRIKFSSIGKKYSNTCVLTSFPSFLVISPPEHTHQYHHLGKAKRILGKCLLIFCSQFLIKDDFSS